ncbi:beta/gamma crystallin domain-containing protein 1 [Cololabis saira]|uniref:beta/gamma crystallin domain-containing protein 1 n=1 Tax=Cololabis saira TaxID=129043 RepID=UPI002AD1FF6D|nr:beta/gamma crystallin domain-containing protein 1 [Cololabis saira]
MAKKSLSTKTLRAFFSRKDEPAQADSPRDEAERRKKFTFPKLKMKVKDPAARRTASDGPQRLSVGDPRTPSEDRETNNIASVRKSATINSPSGRAKGKEFSYSELDLRKPRRIATFSFGLKKKRKDSGNISKSSFGLHSSEMEKESPMDLDQTHTKTRFSVSQPELDSSGTFDIPSLPPVASNQAQPYFTLPDRPPATIQAQLALRDQSERREHLRSGFQEKKLRAPIASVPELQLNDSVFSEEMETVWLLPPSFSSDARSASSPITSDPPDDTVQQSHRSTEPTGTAALGDQPDSLSSDSCRPGPAPKTINVPPDAPRGPQTFTSSVKTHPAPSMLQTLQGCPTSSPHSSSCERLPSNQTWTSSLCENVPKPPHGPSLPSERNDATYSELTCSPPEPDAVTTAASLGHRPASSDSSSVGSAPRATNPPPAASPADLEAVHGALYTSLFPPSFTSKITTRSEDTNPKPVLQSSRLPLNQTRTSSQPHDVAEPPNGSSSLTESVNAPDSEPCTPTAVGSAPPSIGQVTASARRGILVKQLTTKLSSPPTHKMDPPNGAEGLSQGPGQMEEGKRPLSPQYLSVGSDDSGATEVYYSAQEDTGEDSGGEETPGHRGAAAEQLGREEAHGGAPMSHDQLLEVQGKEEAREEGGGEDELPSSPVLQVNRLLECDSAPPTPNLQREGSETGAGFSQGLQDQFRDCRNPRHLLGALAEEDEDDKDGHAHTIEGVESISQHVDRNAAESLPDEPAALNPDTRPDGHAQDEARLEHRTVVDQDPEDRMSYGYSRVALPTEASPQQHVLYLIQESQESGPGSEFTWRNRFEGVSPYRSRFESAEERVAPDDSLTGQGRSSVEWAELAAPAGEGEAEAADEIKPRWDSHQLPDQDESCTYTGLFKATLVDLVEPAAPTTPDSPLQLDMDSLVDTLRSMGPTLRPRSTLLRPVPTGAAPALPPISEDQDTVDRRFSLPADLGLKRNAVRDNRSPLELMKSREDLHPPTLNGNGVLSPPSSSRLEGSLLFGSLRSPSVDSGSDGKAQRTLFRAASLPEKDLSSDRLSTGSKTPAEVEPVGSRLERLSFLVNSSSSGSLTGTEDSSNRRMSRPPSLSSGSPPANAPNAPNAPTSLQRPPLSLLSQGLGVLAGPVLQRSLSSDGGPAGVHSPLFGSMHGGSQFQSQPPEPEPDRNLMFKYRAFPDAYLTKEKEHGKLNPRPGKMYVFDRPGMCGQRIEMHSDVTDATSWELQETFSIRVVRGGWVLYEKPNFKGEKIALHEGDTELTCPFRTLEEEPQNGQQEGEGQNGQTSDDPVEKKPAQRSIIGSVRRAVRDYSVPEISLFPEENAEGKKVIFRDTSEDARIFGFPIKANSIIINAGLWLVFSQPFFQGDPRVLEVGGYSNPASWGVEQPYVGSLHPLKVGEPTVENMSEPKMVIYDKPYFSGKSRIVTMDMRDFITRTDRQQTAFMYSVGSLKVLGGVWVGYEKEGFRGHQYLLEEGEYHDWRTWGGCDSELRSARVIRADLTDPMMVMFEQPEEEDSQSEENTFEVTETIPDVELFGFKTSTRSINVVSGAWIAYSHVDFSGNQYILEKGFYNNCADWGTQDARICSVQPILLAPKDVSGNRHEIILYPEPDFQGECKIFENHQDALADRFLTRSIRVAGGSWVLYEDKNFSGNLYVLSEGEYPSLASMGCPLTASIRSVKPVPLTFSVPSISLFGLECLEGREITMDTEITSMLQEGLNNNVLSIRVNSGCWVVCEHTNYRGRQFLLEPIEITNWPKFSSLQRIGSMYPVRQKRHFFRIKNVESGHFISVQGGVDEMKSGRVVASPEVEPMSDIWFYQDGLIKNKMSPTMSLQVMSNVEPAAKVLLWSETRQPIQTWTAQMEGLITSLTFPGMVLDIKGGKSYDRDHLVVMPESDDRPSQRWKIQLL